MLNQRVVGGVVEAISIVVPKLRQRAFAGGIERSEKFSNRLFAGDWIQEDLPTGIAFEDVEMRESVAESVLTRSANQATCVVFR